MRLAGIASALAIVLCVAVFGGILLQKASLPVPAPAPPQATPTEGRAPGSVVTVADSAAESAVAAPVAAAQTWPMPSAMPTSCSNPNALGISRVVEIDTTGGPGFGFEHFKSHDFLREGEVVLTFDDGPWPKNTPAVLAALAAHAPRRSSSRSACMPRMSPESSSRWPQPGTPSARILGVTRICRKPRVSATSTARSKP